MKTTTADTWSAYTWARRHNQSRRPHGRGRDLSWANPWREISERDRRGLGVCHLLQVRLAAFTKAGMYSVSFPPHVRWALSKRRLKAWFEIRIATWPTSRRCPGLRGTSAQAPHCSGEAPWGLPSHTGSFLRRFAGWPTNPRRPSHPSRPRGCAAITVSWTRNKFQPQEIFV